MVRIFVGDLENEEAVLEWLLEFRDTADNDEEVEKGEAVIEDVSTSILEKMIENSENLAVLFCKFSFSVTHRSLDDPMYRYSDLSNFIDSAIR